jgi:protein gp37
MVWNCVRGCSAVSPGCKHCYAERVAAQVNRRFAGAGRAEPYAGLVAMQGDPPQPRWTGVVRLVPEHLHDPLAWTRPRRIFVNSMSDLFHEALTNEEIAAVFGVMAAARRHTFQVLTKRARQHGEHHRKGRMVAWFEWLDERRQAPLDYVLNTAAAALGGAGQGTWSTLLYELARAPLSHNLRWPLANVWMGVSVENQNHGLPRIQDLRAIPAALRFLSIEPLLEDLGRFNLSGIGWVIAGCESGPSARGAQARWFRSIRDQCAAQHVPFFLKQATPEQIAYQESPSGVSPPVIALRHLVRRGVGSKVKAGGVIELPYLDGVQHASFPEVAA